MVQFTDNNVSIPGADMLAVPRTADVLLIFEAIQWTMA